jgi:hypothetical protein
VRVEFGRNGSQVVLRDASVDRSEPYGGGTLFAELHADGLVAARRVRLYAHGDLEDFFDSLAEDWRGWDGARCWESPEHDLEITARHRTGGHVLIRVELRDGPVPDVARRT